jgi:type I site-specific restriction endonuclease
VNAVVEAAVDATEADVELKVIMPLLTDQNFLAIPAASIKGKAYLAPTALDKSAGKTGGYYPDFSVWELALPVLVVEAKEPEVAVQVGFREASLYARHLNEDYKSGVNPCKFILACNGVDLAYGTWDSNAATMVKVADLRSGSNWRPCSDFATTGCLPRMRHSFSPRSDWRAPLNRIRLLAAKPSSTRRSRSTRSLRSWHRSCGGISHPPHRTATRKSTRRRTSAPTT